MSPFRACNFLLRFLDCLPLAVSFDGGSKSVQYPSVRWDW